MKPCTTLPIYTGDPFNDVPFFSVQEALKTLDHRKPSIPDLIDRDRLWQSLTIFFNFVGKKKK